MKVSSVRCVETRWKSGQFHGSIELPVAQARSSSLGLRCVRKNVAAQINEEPAAIEGYVGSCNEGDPSFFLGSIGGTPNLRQKPQLSIDAKYSPRTSQIRL